MICKSFQKNIIKSAQPMLLLFDTVVKAKAEKKAIQPIEILLMLADAVTLIGHASYLTSLKRREFLNPFPSKGFSIGEQNRLALDRVKSISALSAHSAAKGLTIIRDELSSPHPSTL